MVDASIQHESGLSLKDDIANLLNDSTLHDLTIVCSDNVEIRASCTLLATRSSVFKHMLYSPEASKSQVPHRIHFENIQSRAMGAVLRYIHTETVGSNSLSLSDTFDTYQVARLLCLPKLMKLAIDRIAEATISAMPGRFLTVPLIPFLWATRRTQN